MAQPSENKSLFILIKEHLSLMHIGETAVLITYYTMLSIFPLMIALGNLLPVFHLDPSNIMPYVDALVPEQAKEVLSPVLENLLTRRNTGLLSIGMVAMIWIASKGVDQLEKGLGQAYDVVDNRHNIVRRAMAVVAVIIALVLMIALIIIFGLGSIVLEEIAATMPAVSKVASRLADLKWPVSACILFFIFLALYIWAPAAKVRVRDALPGTAFSVAGWMLLVFTFSIILKFFARRLDAYGVLSSFFVLTFWLNIAAVILLLGAVLNAVIAEYRYGKPEMKSHRISQRLNDKIEQLLNISPPSSK